MSADTPDEALNRGLGLSDMELMRQWTELHTRLTFHDERLKSLEMGAREAAARIERISQRMDSNWSYLVGDREDPNDKGRIGEMQEDSRRGIQAAITAITEIKDVIASDKAESTQIRMRRKVRVDTYFVAIIGILGAFCAAILSWFLAYHH